MYTHEKHISHCITLLLSPSSVLSLLQYLQIAPGSFIGLVDNMLFLYFLGLPGVPIIAKAVVHKRMFYIRTNLRMLQHSNIECNIQMFILYNKMMHFGDLWFLLLALAMNL